MTGDRFWYNPYPFTFLPIFYHDMRPVSKKELLKLFFIGPALACRYLTPVSDPNINTGIWVCRDKNYGFGSLHQKARNQTRRALEKCSVEKVNFDYLSKIGNQINRETWLRQGRPPTVFSDRGWQRYCLAASQLPGMEAWGAFCENELAAFAICCIVSPWYYILHQSSLTKFLKYYPNNALAFIITQQALSKTSVEVVSYGICSVEDTEGLNHFKARMGYRVLPAKDNLVLNPAIKAILHFGGLTLLKIAYRIFSESEFLRKTLSVLQRWGSENAVSGLSSKQGSLIVGETADSDAQDRCQKWWDK